MSDITESARGENCTIRIPGYCNGDRSTTVFCHQNGGGMAMKHSDHRGAYGCSGCHDVVDGRVRTSYTQAYIELSHMEGILETQDILIEKGLLILAA